MEDTKIIEIIKNSTPAVISLVITKDLPKVEGFYQMPYQGRQFLIPKIKKGEKEAVKVGGGSGFLVSADGIILTNSHVVHDTKAEYTAFLDHEEKTKHEVEVIARDPIHDIAICKIKGNNLPYLELGDSTTLQLGESVIAVGNALGEFSNTVSLGIISGLSRFIKAQQGGRGYAERLRGLIQTDAAINPGNSGGPLINMEGKVVGINTAVVFGAQNIGFSIPVNQARVDIEEVKQYGRIRMPFLGVRYIIISEDMQKQNKLPVDHGALIMREALGDTAVVRGSSADKVGLKEFDIILEADGKEITRENTLQDLIQEHKMGDKIKIKVLRDKKEKEMEIELEEKSK
ncbi:MAG: trypsin-like peptidase domain-containing protein [Candidatus Spechtbacteria bacterium]|nr:trypsin-like peptidase domain-containing protein [Candidatus Spechtbacteria bacterium]